MYKLPSGMYVPLPLPVAIASEMAPFLSPFFSILVFSTIIFLKRYNLRVRELSQWVSHLPPSVILKFDPQAPHGRRRELTPPSCPLTSAHRPWHMCTQEHKRTNKRTNTLKLKKEKKKLDSELQPHLGSTVDLVPSGEHGTAGLSLVCHSVSWVRKTCVSCLSPTPVCPTPAPCHLQQAGESPWRARKWETWFCLLQIWGSGLQGWRVGSYIHPIVFFL